MDISAHITPRLTSSTAVKVEPSHAPKLTPTSSVSNSPQPHIQNTPSATSSTYQRPLPNATTTNSSPQEKTQQVNNEKENTTINEQSSEASPYSTDQTKNKNQDTDESYSESELDVISTLKARDMEVIAHERAHSSVGGQYAGSPNYSYKTGPDGVKYAVSGEVSIDLSEVSGDPQTTLQKAKQIKAAALAPAAPSSQDLRVAAKADRMASEARSDIFELNNSDGTSSTQTVYNISEHFEQTAHNIKGTRLESDKQDPKQTLSDRGSYINQFYQSSSNNKASSTFDIQA